MIIFFKANMYTTDFWGRVASNATGGAPQSVMGQMKATLLTLIWVFIGVEGASVMGHRAKSRSEAQKATIWGFLLLLAIYVMISIIPYGTLSRDQLASADQPALANNLKTCSRELGRNRYHIGLIIPLLFLGYLDYAASRNNDAVSQRQGPSKNIRQAKRQRGTVASLIIVSVLQTIFLFSLLFTSEAYSFAYSLASAAILFSYIFVGLYQMQYSWAKKEWKQFVVGLLATLFQLTCMVIAGWQQVMVVSISFFPGFIIIIKRSRHEKTPQY